MDSQILEVAKELRALANVKKLYLFNRKSNISGGLASFKLCAVILSGDKLALEREIYRKIDSSVPFDIVLYTIEEWDSLSDEEGTFAHRVLETGCDLIE